MPPRRKPTERPIKGFTKKHGVIIPKREMKKDINAFKFAKLLTELEGIDPKLLNDSSVTSLEIDRRAIGITYDQHVELLQQFVNKVKKAREKN